MKYLIAIALLITLCACPPDPELVNPTKPYTFEAWIKNDTLHVNYQSELAGYHIWVSKDSLHTEYPLFGWGSVGDSGTHDPKYNVIATTVFWRPTYVTLHTEKWDDQIILNR